MQDNDDVIASQLERVTANMPTLYDFDADFYGDIEKVPVETVSSRDMRIPLKLRPGGYFGYFDPAGGDLGTGSGQVLDKGLISTVHMKHAVQWDLKSEWATDDKRKALVKNTQETIVDAMKEFRRQTAGQCMTDGTGVVATVTSESAGTFTCTTDGHRVKLLRPGQRISVYDSTRMTNRTASGPVTITRVDVSANTFTTATTVSGVTAGDVILPEGLTGSTPVGLYGYKYHQSDSTSGSWLGLTRNTTPEVVSSSVDASNGSLALPHARLAINKIADRLGMDHGFKPVARMHLAQVQAYEDLGQLVSTIQKTTSDEGLNLYFGGNMQIAGASIKPSMLWDKTRIDFMVMEMWGRAEMKAPGWLTIGGRKLFEMRGPTGGVAASMVSYIVASWNLYSKNPAAGSYIKSLAIPSGY